MKTLRLQDYQDQMGNLFQEAKRVLERGGLVCLPCNGTYRILADLNNPDAVTKLFQSKRRVGKAPALVFVRDEAMLTQVAHSVHATASRLTQLWPAPLTILFDASGALPVKVRKQLGSAKIGVRVPEDAMARELMKHLSGPLLVSSANREHKHGEQSPAQVRKNFANQVDLFIDAGDLPASSHSTVVDVDGGGEVKVTRQGVLEEALILACLA